MANSAAALAAVAPLETGTIINDAYDYKHYLSRRVHFLSQHDDYKHNMELFPITRRDADYVFTSEIETLSSQEIRRREIMHGFETLLPLPTTNNMATLSNYSLYPEEEYDPNYQHLPGGPSLPSSRASSIHAETNGMLPKQVQHVIEETRVDTPNYESPADKERREFYESQGMPVPERKPQPSKPELTPQLMESIISHLDTYEPSEPPTPAMPVNSDGEPDAPVAEDDDETVRADSPMHDAVAKEEHGDEQVAIMASIEPKSTNVQVMTESSPNGSRDSTLSPPPVSAKSKGSTNPKKSIAQTASKKPKGVAKSTAPITKRRNQKALAVKIPKAPTESPEFSPLTGNLMESILNGTALPSDKAQAIEAQTLLITRLKASKPKAKAFPPEFHSIPANKGKARRKSKKRNEAEEGEFIACVCGSKKEPTTGDWIACDECDVWQHDECMGDAVPDDKEARYLCQVCDPWAHRGLIQELRSK